MLPPAEGKCLARARAGWAGPGLADWVEALAIACDRDNQSRVADRLGVSGATVNAVLGGRYGASTLRIEQLVRAQLMAARVACPAAGDMAADLCHEWQGRALKPASNALQRRMQAACRSCPLSRHHQENRP